MSAWLLVIALVAGCSGDDATAADDRPKRTTTTDASGNDRDGEAADEDASTTSTSVTTTTTPFGDTIDVGDAPPLLMFGTTAAYYFADLMDEPVLLAGPLEQGAAYLASPDATLIAVATPGDAVRPSRVEFISVDTGKAVQTFDIDDDRVTLTEWSPDGKALLVRGSAFTVLRADGSTQVVAAPVGAGAEFVSDGTVTSAVDCSNCTSAQLVTSKGRPVAVTVARKGGVVSGTYDPATSSVQPFAGEWGAAELTAMECTRFTLMSGYVGDGQKSAVFDADSGKVMPIEAYDRNAGCPVASPDGTRVAVALASGGTISVDVATATPTLVARQGRPLAWSKDGSTLVVQGNGTFLVGPDGAGGKAASVTISRLCPLGTTGTLLAEVTGATPETTGLARYDIATDSASFIGKFGLDRTCDVSADGRWVVTSDVIIDLDESAATALRRNDPDGNKINGERRFPGGTRADRVAAGA